MHVRRAAGWLSPVNVRIRGAFSAAPALRISFWRSHLQAQKKGCNTQRPSLSAFSEFLVASCSLAVLGPCLAIGFPELFDADVLKLAHESKQRGKGPWQLSK